MDEWRKVGPTSNLNLKREKRRKDEIFSLFFFLAKPVVGVSRERGEKLLLLSSIYGDWMVGIR